MKHVSGEQMLSLYYGESGEEDSQHLSVCLECRAEFQRVSQLLSEAHALPVPERDANYGAEVWMRLKPDLPPKSQKAFRFTWAWLGPAFAAVAVAAFFLGVFAQKRSASLAFPEGARTRVLLLAMSDHLERSQMLLTELVNANPQDEHLAEEQANARNLLAENRLLRETVGQAGNTLQTSVLDRLERVLMDVANGPANPSQGDLEELQERIKGEGLLLQVRVMGANARHKGQEL